MGRYQTSDDIRFDSQEALVSLRERRGYYSCPTDSDGKPLGHLVGYAGTYDEADDGYTQKLHYVGLVYANFAKAEQCSALMQAWMPRFIAHLGHDPDIDLFLGAPMGGIITANHLATYFRRDVAFAEKKAKSAGTGGQRGEDELVISRHDVEPDMKVAIVEDVCNNFSTTQEMISLVRSMGADPVRVVCLLNRSVHDRVPSTIVEWQLPVMALVRQEIPQYRQDHPLVAEAVAAGRVIWKPKNEWARLEEAMAQKQQGG